MVWCNCGFFVQLNTYVDILYHGSLVPKEESENETIPENL